MNIYSKNNISINKNNNINQHNNIHNNNIIINKNDICISKENNNQYNCYFELKNNFLNVKSIIHFNIINLIYDLNTNVFEKIKLETADENNCYVYILLKPLFEDFGFSQKYICLYVNKIVESNKIIFNIKNHLYSGVITEEEEQLNIDNIILEFTVINNNHVCCNCKIFLENNCEEIPQCIEKMICLLISKIFIKTKEFIEKIN